MPIIDFKNVLKGLTVQEAMRRQVISLPQTESLEQAIRFTIKYKVNAVLITDELQAGLGVVSKTDLMGAYYAGLPVTTPLNAVMVGPPRFCHPADSLDAARSSPHLEIFRKKAIEVLLLADRVDEWMLAFLGEFEGKPLVSVAKGDLDLDDLADAAEKKAREQVAEEYKALVARVKAALGEKVAEVRVTLRLTDSPACVVVERDAMSQHLQRLLKGAGQKTPEMKPILELNPQHPLVTRLKDESDDGIKEWALLLLDQAMLAEGGQVPDPAAFVKRMNRMLAQARTPGASA